MLFRSTLVRVVSAENPVHRCLYLTQDSVWPHSAANCVNAIFPTRGRIGTGGRLEGAVHTPTEVQYFSNWPQTESLKQALSSQVLIRLFVDHVAQRVFILFFFTLLEGFSCLLRLELLPENLCVLDQRHVLEVYSVWDAEASHTDRKSTRLNSSHGYISYAVFCLKKKKNINKEKTVSLCNTCHSNS